MCVCGCACVYSRATRSRVRVYVEARAWKLAANREMCLGDCVQFSFAISYVCGDRQLVDGLNAQFSRGAHISNLGKI